jgi:regulator of protease activity HflC (stomatin/prohibitin superfamily)
MLDLFFTPIGAIIIVLIILAHSVKITAEYERGVIFRLGRFVGIRGPGLFLMIPFVETIRVIDLRIITLDIPSQEVITKDNISVTVDAVLYFKVVDPEKATIEVENYMHATSQMAQTSLRGVVGGSTLDELLGDKDKIDDELHSVIDKATDPWGIKVTSVELKHIELTADMQRAMAREAEAERMKRAKIILAEGEFLAAVKLREASDVLKTDPITLRYLETLTTISKEQNNTILFPVELLGVMNKFKGE